MAQKILVLGSSNVDLIFRVPRFHQPGETITAQDLITVFGGKGANQAIAARHLGGNVGLITKLGDDSYGRSYLKYFVKNGLPRKFLLLDNELPTGTAVIELNPRGENRIVVSRGSNSSLSPRDLRKFPQVWQGVSVFVAQLEIPLPTVRMALQAAKAHGALTLLNPSPSIPLPDELLSLVDFLVPNELEAQFLSGIKMRVDKDLPGMAKRLLGRGVKNVVITLGPKGLFFKNKDEEIRLKAFRVKAVDTTAAGDAFMGALAVGLSEGKTLPDVLSFASAAGALATTKLGAQPSLPVRQELKRFLAKQAKDKPST
jgi:ribokinase